MLYFSEPRNMDKLSSNMGIQFDYEKKCLRILKRINMPLNESAWEVSSTITKQEELDQNTQVNELLKLNEETLIAVSWFCMDMGWI